MHLPETVYSVEDAIKITCGRAIDDRPRRARLLLFDLGVYFLSRDCDEALHFLNLSDSLSGPRPRLAGRVIDALKDGNCAAALAVYEAETS
jgi:hypothetical protein